tara:strand:- start:205 stop:387 length:183 start_codon:yes stop_codon:yes gene_type:complete
MCYLYFIASLFLAVTSFFGLLTMAETVKEQVYFIGMYSVGFVFICHFGSQIIDSETEGNY